VRVCEITRWVRKLHDAREGRKFDAVSNVANVPERTLKMLAAQWTAGALVVALACSLPCPGVPSRYRKSGCCSPWKVGLKPGAAVPQGSRIACATIAGQTGCGVPFLTNARDSSVCITPGYGLDLRGPIPSRNKKLVSSPVYKQAPIQCVPGALSPGLKRPGREADD
jgi:hypothetical protein